MVKKKLNVSLSEYTPVKIYTIYSAAILIVFVFSQSNFYCLIVCCGTNIVVLFVSTKIDQNILLKKLYILLQVKIITIIFQLY